jgi:hypothetical protein
MTLFSMNNFNEYEKVVFKKLRRTMLITAICCIALIVGVAYSMGPQSRSFIELTLTNGEGFLIRTNCIGHIIPAKNGGSYVMGRNRSHHKVKESPEVIRKMLTQPHELL